LIQRAFRARIGPGAVCADGDHLPCCDALICLAGTRYWILSRKRGSPYLWGVVFAAIEVTALALALVRAGWIAGLLVLITSFELRPGRFGRLFAVAGIACVVAFFATAQLQQNKTVSARVGNTENIYNRLATYKQGLEIFRSAPIFGIGIGIDRYYDVAKKRPPEVVSGQPSVTYPHSSCVGLLAEQGLFGFLPFMVVADRRSQCGPSASEPEAMAKA
jgi:O-antigen ligase